MPDSLNSFYVQDAERIMGQIDQTGRLQGKVSALIKKDWIRDGTGFNWQSVQSERTKPNSAISWTAIQANEGATNTCVPTGNVVASATTVQNYSAYQTAFDSEDICLDDARHGYMWQQQTAMIRDNFVKNIYDAWDDRDRERYITLGKWKYIADNGLSYTYGTSAFPLVEPTNYASLALLQAFYTKLRLDGADKNHGAYATRNGMPIFMALMNSECMQQITNGLNTGTANTINYSWMGQKNRNPLLDAWGVERDYGNFFIVNDEKMPRYDFVAGAWVERPFYDNVATTVGNMAQVSSAYENAEYTDIIIFNPEVMTREMVRPLTTVGADTRFDAVNYNGEVKWRNIPSRDQNPDESIGFWRSILKAAYRPRLNRYGYTIRVSRCTNNLYSYSSCSG